MKKLPEAGFKNVELYTILTDQIKSKLLTAGIELGIFDHLSEPVSANAVAAAIHEIGRAHV
jgi:hypothetical protein